MWKRLIPPKSFLHNTLIYPFPAWQPFDLLEGEKQLDQNLQGLAGFRKLTILLHMVRYPVFPLVFLIVSGLKKEIIETVSQSIPMRAKILNECPVYKLDPRGLLEIGQN